MVVACSIGTDETYQLDGTGAVIPGITHPAGKLTATLVGTYEYQVGGETVGTPNGVTYDDVLITVECET